MKSINLEDDLYQFIMDRVASSGKSPSSVLRTELGLTKPSRIDPETSNTPEPVERDSASRQLSDFLESPRFRMHRTAVKKYLAILSFVYQQKPETFERVPESVIGRSRKYFGKSKEELIALGSSVNPQSIPESPYWAVTNNDTSKKCQVLEDVLKLLSYDQTVIEKAKRTL